MSVASDYPYLRQKLAEEEAARAAHGRHDSAATIRASVRIEYDYPGIIGATLGRIQLDV